MVRHLPLNSLLSLLRSLVLLLLLLLLVLVLLQLGVVQRLQARVWTWGSIPWRECQQTHSIPVRVPDTLTIPIILQQGAQKRFAR